MKQKIELVKSRDFGEIISDTFNFIFQNFKPLMLCFFTFCGFFLIANGVTQVLQQTQMLDTMNSISSASSPDAAQRMTPFSLFNWEYFGLSMLLILVMYIVMSIMVYSFMTLYKEKGNIPPTLDEVWGYIRYYFFRMAGAQILLSVLILVGFMICLVPGVWLFPIFALILPIIIIENASFGFAFNKAFNLIKDNWWVTFGTLLIISFIASALSAVVTMPVSAANIISLMFYHRHAAKSSVTGIVLSAVLQQLTIVFGVIPLITAGLCYFNLTEIKDGTGILGRIQGFGKNTPDASFPAEEY